MRNKLVPEIRLPGFHGEWEKRKLEDITTKIGSGKTPKGGAKNYKSEGIPLLRSQNIVNDKVNFNDTVYITTEIDEDMANSRVEKNDVLLNITGASIGRSAVYELEHTSNVNQHVSIIRPISEVNPYFLQLNITSENGQKQIELNQAGGGRQGLNFKEIAKMSFYFPYYKEQEKLGHFYRQLDNTIDLHQRELTTLKQTKRGFLQKMFPKEGESIPEIRFPGFTEEWDQRKLSDITNVITKGTTPRDKSGDGDINFIKVESINPSSGTISYTSKILEEEHEGYLKRSQLESDDILFSIAGTLGRVTIINDDVLPANTNQALAIIRLSEGNVEFIATYLKGKSVEDYIRKNPTVGAQPNISLQQTGNLIINYPEIQEQKKIGSFFKQLDDTIALHEQELDTLKQTKKAFLQKMFV